MQIIKLTNFFQNQLFVIFLFRFILTVIKNINYQRTPKKRSVKYKKCFVYFQYFLFSF